MEFEWVRNTDGYSLERLEPHYLSFEEGSLEGEEWVAIKNVSADVPDWVHRLLADERTSAEQIHFSLTGYDPFSDQSYGDMYLVPNGDTLEAYRPFELYPAIFLELAEIDNSPNGALEFINKFGFLHDNADSELHFPGDIWMVLREHEKIKAAVDAWNELLLSGDATGLRQLVNSELWAYSTGLGVGLEEAGTSGSFSMTVRPSGLYSVIWLQFIQAVSGNHKFKLCEECNADWFQVVDGNAGHKNEKKYCSDACSMRAYRKRKKQTNNG